MSKPVKKEMFDFWDKDQKAVAFMVVFGIILASVIGMIWAWVKVVPAGHVGVKATCPGGASYEELDEGWHFTPFCKVEIIPYQLQVESAVGRDTADDNIGSIEAPTLDQANVLVDLEVQYRIQKDKVADLYITNGDVGDNIIVPLLRQTPRQIIAQYEITELTQKRLEIENKIRQAFVSRIQNNSKWEGVQIDNFLIQGIRLPTEIQDAINLKLAAQQQLLAANFTAQKLVVLANANRTASIINADALAQARIISANATAEAIRIVMEQLNITGNQTDTLSAYLTLQWYEMLQNPDTQVEFIIISPDGNPIIIRIEDMAVAG